MESTPLYKRVISLDVNQAKITADALIADTQWLATPPPAPV